MSTSRMLAPVLALALLLSGCGEDEGGGSFSAATAANATEAEGTARVKMQMRMTGAGLPEDLELSAEGVTALAEPRGRMVVDIGKVLALAGTAPSDSTLEIVFDGGSVYVDPPDIEGLELPGDGGWIALEVRPIVEAFGIDVDAASAIFTMDPASQLRLLQRAGLEQAGSERIDGTETTRYAGAYSLDDLIEGLPADQREAAREALEQLNAASDDELDLDSEQPTEIWVGADSIVRRMRTTSTLPAQDGVPAGRMEMTYELSDFGAELDVSPPEGATDVTDTILRALKGQLAS